VPALTTTSYGILALLALQPWTTYQLAVQMQRSLGWIWPRAVSRLYEEPKKLVAAGLATSAPVATGRRPATVYTITPAGRQALAAWLAEPGAGPVLECEALVKIAYADQGTRDGLLANLAALIDDTTAKLAFGQMIATSYLEGRGPFQERLPLSGLMWRFLWEYHVTVLQWARWARDQVQAWPEDLSQLDATTEFSRIVAAATSPQASW
jgi:PadR family transcriptional regulator, regulatory protein AphA